MSGQDDVNQRIFDKIDAMTSMVNDMRMDVVELRTEIRLRKDCPNPGACIDLAKQVKLHEETIQQARGGWKLIIGATVSSGALGAAISHWLQNH